MTNDEIIEDLKKEVIERKKILKKNPSNDRLYYYIEELEAEIKFRSDPQKMEQHKKNNEEFQRLMAQGEAILKKYKE